VVIVDALYDDMWKVVVKYMIVINNKERFFCRQQANRPFGDIAHRKILT
jgi:hypothetical protein